MAAFDFKVARTSSGVGRGSVGQSGSDRWTRISSSKRSVHPQRHEPHGAQQLATQSRAATPRAPSKSSGMCDSVSRRLQSWHRRAKFGRDITAARYQDSKKEKSLSPLHVCSSCFGTSLHDDKLVH